MTQLPVFFRRKKIPSVKKGKFSELEKFLAKTFISELDPEIKNRLEKQMEVTTMFRRIDYGGSLSVELHNLNEVPKEYLLDRKQEFKMGEVEIQLDGEKYFCDFYAVLGLFFEMKIMPSPKKKFEPASVVATKVRTEPNFHEDIDYEKLRTTQ